MFLSLKIKVFCWKIKFCIGVKFVSLTLTLFGTIVKLSRKTIVSRYGNSNFRKVFCASANDWKISKMKKICKKWFFNTFGCNNVFFYKINMWFWKENYSFVFWNAFGIWVFHAEAQRTQSVDKFFNFPWFSATRK